MPNPTTKVMGCKTGHANSKSIQETSKSKKDFVLDPKKNWKTR
jgi:hypothetical protein